MANTQEKANLPAKVGAKKKKEPDHVKQAIIALYAFFYNSTHEYATAAVSPVCASKSAQIRLTLRLNLIRWEKAQRFELSGFDIANWMDSDFMQEFFKVSERIKLFEPENFDKVDELDRRVLGLWLYLLGKISRHGKFKHLDTLSKIAYNLNTAIETLFIETHGSNTTASTAGKLAEPTTEKKRTAKEAAERLLRKFRHNWKPE